MKFSKKDFQELEIPDLLLNIWCYAEYLHDPIFRQYSQWSVKAAEEQWRSTFLDFDYVINNLKNRNKKFYNFSNIYSADKNVIYRLITKS